MAKCTKYCRRSVISWTERLDPFTACTCSWDCFYRVSVFDLAHSSPIKPRLPVPLILHSTDSTTAPAVDCLVRLTTFSFESIPLTTSAGFVRPCNRRLRLASHRRIAGAALRCEPNQAPRRSSQAQGKRRRRCHHSESAVEGTTGEEGSRKSHQECVADPGAVETTVAEEAGWMPAGAGLACTSSSSRCHAESGPS